MEIKFRAWDIQNETMCKVIQILNFENKMHLILEKSDMGFYSNTYGSSLIGIVLMQYTGLKDSNGNEIYVGDIVKAYSNEAVFKFNIDFKYGTFMYGHWSWADFLNDFKDIQVIGNLYENPELWEDIGCTQ